ncbi:hypothetical protein F4781DRAFT_195902 [Annulohypoxylon bovei var. microspora]|nr:hypothetical protein F4781DRAFT_195902 [Annulohypoxylon bovei var. microspora]
MSRSLNSTQMSAACSRGLTRSHTPPIAPSTPPPRPRLPPHPFRGRPVDEAAAISSSDSPLMGYIPSPIQSPVFSPIRSPFSPCGSFPSTPRTPTTKYFVSPIKDSKGARERRRESRPSPLTSLLAAKGIERQVTPRAPALCPECTKVKMLLPAKWCGHQVTPSRMKDGLRVVRINPNFGRTMGVRAQKPRISRRAGLEKAKPVAADSLVDQVEQQTPIVNEPAAVEPSMPERVTSSSIFDEPTVEPSTLERVTSSSVFDEQTVEPSILDRMTSSPVIDEPAVEQSTPSVANSPIIDQPTVEASTPKRVASSPVVESTPKPSTVCSPSIYTPFKNPYLDDQPLHWSPRMFKSEIDRHNWTWSEWDSPSGTIEDVTYQTEDWPANDPFARYPPHIRDRLREVLAMKPQRTRASDSAERKSAERRSVERKEAEGFSTIPIRLEDFLPSSSSNKPTDSKSEDLSTWVLIDDHPWSPTLLQMYIDGEKDREREAARRKQFKPNDNTSTVSSLATVDFLAEIYYPGSSRSGSNHSESNHSGSIRAGSIRSEPNRSGSIHSDHNCSERIRSKSSRSGSVRSRSHGSGSVGMSSLLDLSSSTCLICLSVAPVATMMVNNNRQKRKVFATALLRAFLILYLPILDPFVLDLAILDLTALDPSALNLTILNPAALYLTVLDQLACLLCLSFRQSTCLICFSFALVAIMIVNNGKRKRKVLTTAFPRVFPTVHHLVQTHPFLQRLFQMCPLFQCLFQACPFLQHLF